MNAKRLLDRLMVGGIALVTPAAIAQADVGTGFTYQGRLDAGGQAANGTYDFRFRLYDAATGGLQIGTQQAADDLSLADGLFTTTIDFGAGAITDDARWLEIGVRPGASGGAFTILTPRQRLNATPVAIQALNDANWAKSGTNISNTNSGNVGINQATPLAKLHVTGANLVANFDATDLDAEKVVIEGQQAWLGLYSDEVGAPASGISLSEIDSTTGALTKWSLVQRTTGNGGDLSVTYGSNPLANSNARYLQIKPTGDVSIGVDVPSARLHVKAFGSEQGVAPASFRAASEFPSGTSGTSTEYIQFEGNEVFAKKDSAFSTLEFQKDGGQVNIGNLAVDSPKLTVSRNFQFISDSNLQFEDVLIHDTANAWLGLYSDSVGNVGSGITFCEYGAAQYKWAMYARTSDNVGDLVFTHGTDVNPTANDKKLQLHTDGRLVIPGVNSTDSIIMTASESGGNGAIELFNASGNRTVQIDGEDSTDSGGFLVVYDSAGADKVQLLGEDANGDGRVVTQVLQITGGSDFSEQFDVSPSADSPPVPGTVVCINPSAAGELIVSSRAYDRTVAGVISGAGGVKPGLLMGQRATLADGQHPVALSGRVYVWCDATDGAILPGDLLTTSNTPGHAMKVAEHAAAQGAIIGKAMTTLDGGRGLVLVLVSLQ